MFGLVGVRWSILGVVLLMLPAGALASSLAPTNEAADVRAALGICVGRVTGIESFRHPKRGGIFTRITIAPSEAIKGRFPERFSLVQRGGSLGNEGESNGLAASLSVGDEGVFFVVRRPDGSLELLRGFAGVDGVGKAVSGRRYASDFKLRRIRQLAAENPSSEPVTGIDSGVSSGVLQDNSGGNSTATGLLVSTLGVPFRYVAPDRGEPIGYLVDAQALPAGISQAQALTAVSQALAAWTAVTGVTFRYDGLQNFGVSAASVTTSDERVRIQLHDLFGEITGNTTLGVGGSFFSTVSSDFTNTGGGGGQVNGLEFHKSTRGYVVLKHTAASMSNLSSFIEVLCHEIGHVLGMAHSSNDPAEPSTLLNEAIMYYRIHGDGRGASLGTYDPPVIQKVHPPLDSPPFSADRILPLVTAPSAITAVPGINEIQLLGCDLQSASGALALITSGPFSSPVATASFTGNTMKIAQNDFWGDGSLDPAGTSFYLLKWVRFSDGVNCSPWTRVRVVTIHSDSSPATADGLPDMWMTTYFGSITSSAATLSRAGDDKDGDGVTNINEFRMGTNPVDPGSRLRVTSFDASSLQWLASPYRLYVIEFSTDLATWTRFGNPVVPTTSVGQATGNFIPVGTARRFYRVWDVP